MIPARTALVQVDPCLLDTHGRQWCRLLQGRLVPEAATAAVALHRALFAAGGLFRLSSLWRSHEDQERLRLQYEIGAGAPAQRPGTSAHQGGRAIDVATGALGLPVPPDRQLDRLWELAIPIGWRPVIDRPDETRSERWHLDYWGDWEPVRARRGYSEAAIAAIVDLGDAGQAALAYGDTGALARCVQSHLHRAGYDCGAIDGAIGPRTRAAVRAAGIDPARATGAIAAACVALPSSAEARWTG